MSEIVLEKWMNGKSVDVAVKAHEGWQAFEIQLSSSVRSDLLRDMLIKDLKAGFVKVFVCVESRKDIEAVNKIVAELEELPDLFGEKQSLKEKVVPKLLADFL